jgi:hypothetical protein
MTERNASPVRGTTRPAPSSTMQIAPWPATVTGSGSSDQQMAGLLEDWNAVHLSVQILCSAPW